MTLPNSPTIFLKIIFAFFAQEIEIMRKIMIFQSLTQVALR